MAQAGAYTEAVDPFMHAADQQANRARRGARVGGRLALTGSGIGSVIRWSG